MKLEQSRIASRFVCYSFRLNVAVTFRVNEIIIPLLRRRSPRNSDSSVEIQKIHSKWFSAPEYSVWWARSSDEER